mgnify:CR=1 FL=1
MLLESVCVYCGSSPGRSPAYLAAAEKLGTELASRNIRLVYGGAKVGLMGAVAQAVLDGGGKVTGIIPESLAEQEVAFTGLDDLIVVDSMHTRKAVMADKADGFVALPGGFGTLDESFEILTWAQIGLHAKPFGLLNINGYYDQLLSFLDHTVEEMFVYAPHRDLVMHAGDCADLLNRMAAYERAPVKKTEWVRAMKKHKRA